VRGGGLKHQKEQGRPLLRPFLARGGLRFPVSAPRYRLQIPFGAPVSSGKNPVPNLLCTARGDVLASRFSTERRDRLMITTVTRCWFRRCHSLRLLAAHVVASSVNLSVKRFCWSSSTLPIFAFIWFPISGRLSRRFRIRAFSGKLSDLIRKSACRI